MSQFDKICESCDEEFSSFIETVCDDCHDESEKERADEFEKLKKENASLRESLEKLEKEIETAIDSLLFYAQGRDPVIRRLTDNGEGQLSAWQCARALLDKIKAKGGL